MKTSNPLPPAIHDSLILLMLMMTMACQSDSNDNVEKAPIFDNLGKHTLKITTASDEAQKFFNQGLNLSYGFNHAEAARSF